VVKIEIFAATTIANKNYSSVVSLRLKRILAPGATGEIHAVYLSPIGYISDERQNSAMCIDFKKNWIYNLREFSRVNINLYFEEGVCVWR
jgi:hypothetical protein